MNIVTTVANLFVVIMWSFGNYIAIYTEIFWATGI